MMIESRHQFTYGGHDYGLRLFEDTITLTRDGEALMSGPKDVFHMLNRQLTGWLTRRPPNSGTRWSAEDDAHLLCTFHSLEQLPALARHFGRSVTAVRARLVGHGLLDDDAGLRFRVQPPPVPPT